ncbi:MAG: 50S ribosomal protein L23 [Bacteroidetes bacterium]|nr:50S ribosomal protein L23 [Bacteroidota bacterium]
MDILMKPIITEKMTAQGEKLGKYGFIVDKTANKIQIAGAVEEMYGVTVEGVSTMNVPAKARSRYTKKGIISGRKSGYKKAVVTLSEGETIDFFSDI